MNQNASNHSRSRWLVQVLLTGVGAMSALSNAAQSLLDTRREALEAGQELQRLTGLDFNAVQTSADKPSNP